MHCMNCGTELPDVANFCWKCGEPVKPASNAGPITEYEHCSIESRSLDGQVYGGRGVIEAKVGDRVVAEVGYELRVPGFWERHGSLRDETVDEWGRVGHLAYVELVSKLTSMGWEIFPPNQEHVSTLRRPKR